MKLKYYLRGLGIGIAVTVIIMSAAMKGVAETPTEKDALADRVEEVQTQSESTESEEAVGNSAEIEAVSEASTTTSKQASEVEKETQIAEPSKEAIEPSTADVVEKIIEITIGGGESSVSVSRKLEQAGLVSSSSEYDAYLCRNGYDKKITTGKHRIQEGATEEEIAKIITSKASK